MGQAELPHASAVWGAPNKLVVVPEAGASGPKGPRKVLGPAENSCPVVAPVTTPRLLLVVLGMLCSGMLLA